MDKHPIFYYLTPFSKLLILILLVFSSFMVVSSLGLVLGIPFFGRDIFAQLQTLDYNDPVQLPLLKYLQILSQVGIFVIPPLVFAYLVNRNVSSHLLADSSPDLLTALLVISLIFLSLPFISWLIEWNQQLRLPAFLQGAESWMKDSESRAEEVTRSFLNTASWGGFLVNLLMIVMLPALGEELLFRGTLIRLFREWTGNIHLAVVISSLLFSSMHMQFYGFIPRLILGLILAYLFVWTANLWIAVLAHFVNNGLAVIASFLFQRGVIRQDFDNIGNHPAVWEVLASLSLVLVLLWVIFKRQQLLRLKRVD